MGQSENRSKYRGNLRICRCQRECWGLVSVRGLHGLVTLLSGHQDRTHLARRIRPSQSSQSLFTFGSSTLEIALFFERRIPTFFSSLNKCATQEANGIASWGAGNAGKGPSPTTFGGQTHCTVIHNNFVPSPRQASSHLHAMCSVCPVLWYIGRLRVYKSATWNRASKLDELHSAPILHTPTTISALHPSSSF